MRIQLDPAKLAAKGLSLEDVRTQLVDRHRQQPKGTIDGATRSFTIYANDQLTDGRAWNDVIVAYRNGAPMRVRDIGLAVDGPGGRQAGRPGRTASAASSSSSSSSRAPTSSRRSTRSRPQLPRLTRRDPAGHQGQHR